MKKPILDKLLKDVEELARESVRLVVRRLIADGAGKNRVHIKKKHVDELVEIMTEFVMNLEAM